MLPKSCSSKSCVEESRTSRVQCTYWTRTFDMLSPLLPSGVLAVKVGLLHKPSLHVSSPLASVSAMAQTRLCVLTAAVARAASSANSHCCWSLPGSVESGKPLLYSVDGSCDCRRRYYSVSRDQYLVSFSSRSRPTGWDECNPT